jgi:hypothetical protein
VFQGLGKGRADILASREASWLVRDRRDVACVECCLFVVKSAGRAHHELGQNATRPHVHTHFT